MKSLEVISIGIFGVLALTGFAFSSLHFVLSAGIGFGICMVNYALLKKGFRLLASQQARKAIVMIVLKYILLVGMLGVSILYFDLHIVGLLLGLSTLVMAALGLGIQKAFMS